MNTDTQQNALERALAHLAGKGIAVPADVMQQAETARLEAIKIERLRLEEASKHKGRLQRAVDNFIASYPALQDSVVKVGNWSMALIKLFAVNGLASVIMFAALIAEMLRVIAGLVAIETSPLVAVLISVVVVALVFFLTFVRFYLEREAGYLEPTKYKWSLRIVLRSWRYKLGLGGDNWQADQTTPAQSIITAQRTIQFAVVITALYGSMAHMVSTHPGTWLQALISIVTTSSLSEFAAWSIGLLITVAIMLSATTTSHFVASRAKLLEDSIFAKGEDKIELLGFERAANAVMTYYEQVRKQRLAPPSLASAAELPIREFSVSIQADTSRIDTPIQAVSIQKSIQGKPMEIARKWLTEHPDHGLTIRKAADSAGVSVSAMQRAMKK